MAILLRWQWLYHETAEMLFQEGRFRLSQRVRNVHPAGLPDFFPILE